MTNWDVIVVGGGPAGMMAAGTAARMGAGEKKRDIKVLLIEKNDTLGKKLLITGGGRCNVTNAEFDDRKLLAKFKANGRFLFSAFSQFSVKETLDFFHIRTMPTKVEALLRVFPVSDSAQSVWDVLVATMKQYKVTVLSNTPVIGIVREGDTIMGVRLKDKTIVRGHSIIIATGGMSRPETGSTGDAYAWLAGVGHTIIPPSASLVPLAMKDAWIKRLAGVTLPEVKMTVLQNNEKQSVAKGKILFTHVGISGPTILNMSKDVGELLKYGDVTIVLDIMPTTDQGALDKTLRALFTANLNKKLRNVIAKIIPAALVPVIIQLSGIDGDKQCNAITRDERAALARVIKAIPMQVRSLLGVDKAIITSGGVALEEVDFKTMRSRLFPNLYIIGDMLNIDRPSGGYSLQLCWTTGFVAGNDVAINVAGATHQTRK